MQTAVIAAECAADTANDAFLELIEKYRHELYRFAVRTLWNPNIVDDVFQSAVLSAYENFHKFTPGTNFRAWVYQILVNKCYVANRETRRSAKPLDEVDPNTLQACDRPEYGDVLADPNGFLDQCGDEVIRAFEHLSTAERSCILLRSSEGLSYQEIAAALQMPVGTVMTHLSRGRAKLRSALLEYATGAGIVTDKSRGKRTHAPAVPHAASN